jgi:diguanylate cyclase (GGDEF)-like protein/PAS domain S-box-containing protein
MRDITRRKQGEQAARHLADIVESSSDAILSKNLDDVVTSWNAAAERLYGYRAEEIIGRSSHVLLPPDRKSEEQHFLERLRRAEHIERLETVRVKKDGGLIEVAVTISPLRDASGHIVGISTIVRDITERKRREAHTRALTVTDELTGLHNRRGFVSIAELQLKLARRSRAPLHVGFIDLDGMKAINDRFGHAVGDEALKETAALLRASFRDSDVLARVGGDEFVVLTIGADDQAMKLIQERLFAAVAKANREAQHPYALSLSLGVVVCDLESGASLDQMIEEADRRMYQVKGEKRRADRHKTP